MTNRLFGLPIVLLALLAGCNMATPSELRTGSMIVKDDMVTQSMSVDDMGRERMVLLARDYHNRARGPLILTVAYPVGDAAEKQRLQSKVQRAVNALKKEKVKPVEVEYVGVEGKDVAGRVVAMFPAFVATAPDSCRPMPGLQGGESWQDTNDYQFSCETKDVMSRMIAHPEDLLGVDGSKGGTARRTGTVVETYQDGVPNESFLGTASASEIGN